MLNFVVNDLAKMFFKSEYCRNAIATKKDLIETGVLEIQAVLNSLLLFYFVAWLDVFEVDEFEQAVAVYLDVFLDVFEIDELGLTVPVLFCRLVRRFRSRRIRIGCCCLFRRFFLDVFEIDELGLTVPVLLRRFRRQTKQIVAVLFRPLLCVCENYELELFLLYLYAYLAYLFLGGLVTFPV